jgi:hypothetical protein
MVERPVRFRVGGLTRFISEVEWPAYLPLPPSDLTIIRMPNHEQVGIAVDGNNEYYNCLLGTRGYEWGLA